MRIALFLIYLFISYNGRCQLSVPKLKQSLNLLMDQEWKDHSFSGVVLVANHGKPVFFESRGYRNFDTKTVLGKNDLFELASVSKQFTAMIILMLKEKGPLGIDDDIARYIPDLPWSGITIRHLLTHTSGLPDYQSIMDKHWDKSKVADNIDCIEYLKKYPEPLHFRPGQKYEYSNTGYLLLASIAEKATGKFFPDVLNERIFKPLKMKTAALRTPATRRKVSNFAMGYIFDSTKNSYQNAELYPESNYTIWLGHRKGPGRISMNASDLFKWDKALYTPLLISDATMEEAFTPYSLLDGTKSNYGFGWELQQDVKLGKVVQHTGDNPGYHTLIKRFTEKELTIIILNNNASDRVHEIQKSIRELLVSTYLK